MQKNENGQEKVSGSLKALEDKLGIDSTATHAKNVFLSAIAAIPYVGGVLSSLITTYAYDFKMKRVAEFIEELNKNISGIKDKVDSEYLKREEFLYLFEQTFRSVSENYHKEKLDSLKFILLNSMRNPADTKQEERELFLKMVNDMTVRHIRILRFLNNPMIQLQPNLRKMGDRDRALLTVDMVFKIAFPQYSDTEILYILQDFRAWRIAVNFDERILSFDAGLARLGGLLTPYGKKLVSFISHL